MTGPAHGADRRAGALVLALLWIAPALFASNNVLARFGADAVSPFTLAFWRWTITAAVLLPFMAGPIRRSASLLWAQRWRILVLAAFGMVGTSTGTYFGAQFTTATNIGLIYAAAPVLIVVLDWLLAGRRPRRYQVAGLAAGLAGVLVVILRGDLSALAGLVLMRGDLLVAAGATCWAVYSVLLRGLQAGLEIVPLFTVLAAVGAVLCLPLYGAELATGAAVAVDARAVAVIVLVALLAGLGAPLAHAFLTASLGAGRTGMILYLIPVYNAALAWLFLGEAILAYHVAGAALVLSGVWLATRTR